MVLSKATSMRFGSVTRGRDRARDGLLDTLIVDTAGRLHVDEALMQELSAVHRAVNPAATLLVVDAMTGQEAVRVAQSFDAVLPVTAFVLTKLDGTAKGGVAVSIAHDLKLPIRYVGVGEGIDDLIPFSPQDYVDALFQEKW